MRITPILSKTIALITLAVALVPLPGAADPIPPLCNQGGMGNQIFNGGPKKDEKENFKIYDEWFRRNNAIHTSKLPQIGQLRDHFRAGMYGYIKNVCEFKRSNKLNLEMATQLQVPNMTSSNCGDENVKSLADKLFNSRHYTIKYKDYLEKLAGDENGVVPKLFEMNVKANRSAIDSYVVEVSPEGIPGDKTHLNSEYEMMWSYDPHENAHWKPTDLRAQKGMFALFTTQLRRERDAAIVALQAIEGQITKVNGICKGLVSIDHDKLNGTPPSAEPAGPSDVTGTGDDRQRAKVAPEGKGTIAPTDGKKDPKGKLDGPVNPGLKKDEDPFDPKTEGPGAKGIPPEEEGKEGKGKGTPAAAPEETPLTKEEIENRRKQEEERILEDERSGRQQTPPPKDEESWLSRNKGTVAVVGVGALATGGLIYYYNQQEKDRKKKDKEMREEARMLAAMQGSGSTSTSTTTSTWGGIIDAPQGSVLQITSGIPAGATVGTSIGTITVAIIAPNGQPTQDSDTVVTLSCASPQPCSIAGTLTTTSVSGVATFNFVHFTSPQTSVRLMVTAPGFAPSAAGSMFNVSPL